MRDHRQQNADECLRAGLDNLQEPLDVALADHPDVLGEAPDERARWGEVEIVAIELERNVVDQCSNIDHGGWVGNHSKEERPGGNDCD
jgi:hypothetical protein